MTGALQASLSGGELSPGLWGRTDLARYMTCLETAKNVIIQPYGGIKNRAGFEFLGEVRDSDHKVRLIPFIYSEDFTFVLEFGPGYIRFWHLGELQLYNPAITAWSAAVSYQSYGIVKSYNGVNYYNLVVPNLNHNPATSPTYWHPLDGTIVEVPSPYLEAELADISFAQSGNTLFIAHQNHRPMVLQSHESAAWSILPLYYVNGPFSIINSSTASLRISAVTGSITITNAGGTGIFTAAMVGQLVYIESANYGIPWQTGRAYNANDIVRSDGKYYIAVNTATSGTIKPIHERGTWSDGAVNWTYLNSGFGIAEITAVAVGGVTVTATVVSRFPEDLVSNASLIWAYGDWGGPNGYPGTVCIHQQRLTFGGSPEFPETIWMSRVGSYTDFGTSSPVVDDDSLSLTLGANTVHEIRGLLSHNNLVVMTSGGAWALGIGDNGALTPSNCGAQLQSFRGSAKLDPIGIGRSGLYLQNKGQIIRDLAYELNSSSYQAFDLTMLASHLFEGFEILEWAWQEVPFQTLWAVRDDGVLLSCAYVREQEVLGWAQHDLGGVVESVCTVPEGNENALYVVVVRNTYSSPTLAEGTPTPHRYLERMHGRFVSDLTEAFFVDSGLFFDNSDVMALVQLTITGGTNWDETEQVNCLSDIAGIFDTTSDDDLGDQLVFVLSDGSRLRFTVEQVLNASTAKVRANRTIPEEYRNVLLPDWDWARNSYAMAHLIGNEVVVLADGLVQAPVTVAADGTVAIDPPATKVSIGLAYNSDLKTLDPAINLPETPMDKRKNITQVRFKVRESRNMKAGRDFDNLYEFRPRNAEIYDATPTLQSGIVGIAVACTWEPQGVICLRQDQPLPINWIALIPDIQIGGK